MNLPDTMTWAEIEKFMTDNPDTILSIYSMAHKVFLDRTPVFLDAWENWDDIPVGKFRHVANEILGLETLEIRNNLNESGASTTRELRAMNKLKPGLELDKLIAEKVLGWYQDSDIGGPRAWWFEKGGEGDIDEDALYLDHFSEDIRAAWGLVEKFKLVVFPLSAGWAATKTGRILIDNEANKAPTAPHAICLAALFYANEDDE